MDGKRSYLDSLNNGRQRRAQDTLDDLNRSLERLGERLERRDELRSSAAYARSPRHQADDTRSRERERFDRARAMPQREEHPSHAPRDDAFMATTGRLAAEVKGLREELRHQMNSGLRQEFDSLRDDIARAYSAAAADPRASAKLSQDLEGLSHAIQQIAEQSDDRGMGLLRQDIEQVKSEIDQLAREDTLRSFDSRWQDFDRRWSDLEHRMDSRAMADPAIDALNGRLQQITDAVNSLPESLSLKSLEEKVRTLAGAVDHFSRQQEERAPQLFDAIDQRLDEISRAIVASSMAAQPAPDYDSINRIENRISALAGQLDELSQREPSGEILDRLNMLSRRIDEVAVRADLPAQSVERLANQIAIIADHIETGSAGAGTDEIMRGIEARLDQFADALERRQENAIENSQMMFRDLEARLYDVVSRLDPRPAVADSDNAGLMEAIDKRLQDFSHKLEARRADLLEGSAVRHLEAKIDTISSRMERAQPASLGVDPDVIRNLEAQVAELSSYLSKPDQAAPILDSLSPRLDQMEKAIRGSRDMVIDAARRAAEDVVRSFSGNAVESEAVAGLTQDLKSLESITRRSDDRNSKTFEAIHDTLLKIVDRLGTMEASAAAPAAKLNVAAAPSLVPADMPAIEPVGRMRGDSVEMPADDRIAAEVMAETTDAGAESPKRKRSMLGGLSRAFTRKKGGEPAAVAAGTTDAVAAPVEPKLDLDEPLDPRAANRPLQPGSGAPDLSRIMKRVREERAPAARTEEAATATSDFIAAARRNAQAAAAEAEVLKRHSEMSGGGRGFKLGQLLKAGRKPILMGAVAIMIALTGLQLSKALMKDRGGAQQSAAVTSTAEPAAPAKAGAAAPAASVAEETPPAMAAPEDSTRAALPPALEADEPADVATSAPGEPTNSVPPVLEEPTTLPAAPQAMAPAEETTTAALPPAAEPSAAALPPLAKAPADAGPVALREAADAGDPKAMFEIGARYTDGRGTKADNKKAAEWYENAAELGLAPAQYRIGNMYEKGIGVDRDLNKAKMWYQMAADQGNASAMHNLAVLFAMGADGTTDNESAARWFIKAGELGVKDSQFNLGILNAKGVGMPQNLEESYKWFALVAKTGDRDAASKRDEIANSLRPEQLERAKAATESWKPQKVDENANTVDVPEAWKEGTEMTASVDMKKAVQTIQLILNKNGYDAGGADGVMGQKTKNAIVAFQKDNNLPANGEVTEKLVQELLARK